MKLLFLTCLLAVSGYCHEGSLVREAPPKVAVKRNPLEGDERARLAGAKLYARECSACHGMQAQGTVKAPGLRRTEVQQAPAGALFWVLKNGALHHGMPSFAHLPEAERWQIVTFLQSLKNKE